MTPAHMTPTGSRKRFLYPITLGLSALAARFASAQATALQNASDVAKNTGLGGTQQGQTLPALAGNIISTLLGMVGVIVVIMIIYGGFLWMTAGGDTEKVSKGKKILTNSIIGLIIVFAAYAITSFVVTRVISSTT